jgi:hypothetical protein
MNTTYLKFFKKLIKLTVAVFLVFYAATYFMPEKLVSPAMPYLILLSASVTLIFHYIIIKAAEKKFSRFISYFMIATVMKLLLYLIVIFLYVYLNKNDVFPFVITFLLLYIIFSVFEVINLLQIQNSSTKDNLEKK